MPQLYNIVQYTSLKKGHFLLISSAEKSVIQVCVFPLLPAMIMQVCLRKGIGTCILVA